MINKQILEARKRKRKSKLNLTYTTGYPALNIDFFNRRFGGLDKVAKEAEKAAEEASSEINTDLNIDTSGAELGSEAVGADNTGNTEVSAESGLGESIKELKLPHLDKLLKKLNGPTTFEDEIIESSYNFTYDVDKNTLRIYDKNEVYHYGYADDFYYDFGYKIEDHIYEDIEKALKADKILDKDDNLDWYDEVVMFVALPENLTEEIIAEAKRDVRRYFIRPQHIYCANKDEVISALISIGDANCSVYTLNNLEDNNDIHKLQSSDIIYYYDNGILYDKNRQKVFDWDLKIRHEEERKKINLDTASDATKAEVYSDRIIEDVNELDLDFADVNAFGETLKEGKVIDNVCCICGEHFEGYGNNPEPYKSGKHGEKCCDSCNQHYVIPERLKALDAKEN